MNCSRVKCHTTNVFVNQQRKDWEKKRGRSSFRTNRLSKRATSPFLLGGISVVGGTAFVLDTAISHNLAIGGAGSDGSDGGNGGGGGVYNDASSSLRVERSTVTENHANGGDGGDGGSAGEGIGGGVYNLAVFNLDAFTVLNKNHASTSDDDIFGPFVLL